MLSAKSTAAGLFTTTRPQMADTPIATEATKTGMQSNALPATDAMSISSSTTSSTIICICSLLIMHLNQNIASPNKSLRTGCPHLEGHPFRVRHKKNWVPEFILFTTPSCCSAQIRCWQ